MIIASGKFLKLCEILSLKKKKVYFFIIITLLLGVCLEGISLGLILPMLSIFSGNFDNQDYFLIENLNKFFLIENNKDLILYSSIFFLTIFSIKTIIMIFVSWIVNKFSYELEANICQKIYNKIIEESYLKLVDKSSSKLLQNFIIDSSILTFNIILPLFRILTESMILLVLVSVLLYFTFQTTLMLVPLMTIVIVAYFYIVKNKIFFWGLKREELDGKRIHHIQKTLDGIKEIKVSKFEKIFKSIFNHLNFKLASYNKKHNILLDFPRFFLEFFAVVMFIFFIIFFLRFEDNTKNLLPLIGLVVGILFRALPSINRIIVAFQLIKFGVPVIERIHSEIFNKNDFTKNYSSKNLKVIYKEFSLIEIKNLNFKYPNSNQTILENINLKIYNKDIIGIYGDSGSGKTTFLNIFLGLIEEREGEILIDSEKISSFYKEYGEKIFYLPQNVFIFEDTIKNNIILNRNLENKDKEELQFKAVLELSGLTESLNKMPNRENTMLLRAGASLSGGQKQKIGIARALYDYPKILILDESTNALDKKTQDFILHSLQKIHSISLIIIISHDRNAFKICNRVFKLIDKSIVEVSNVQ